MKTFASCSRPAFLFAVALMVCMPIHAATIYRCPAPNGGVNYTDAPCPSTGEKLDVRPNVLNTSGSRAAAAWAERRQAQRAAQEIERSNSKVVGINSPQRDDARAATTLRKGSRGVMPSAPPQPSTPSVITGCDSAGCMDTSGHRYHNDGGGNFVRSDGKFCINLGGVAQCH